MRRMDGRTKCLVCIQEDSYNRGNLVPFLNLYIGI